MQTTDPQISITEYGEAILAYLRDDCLDGGVRGAEERFGRYVGVRHGTAVAVLDGKLLHDYYHRLGETALGLLRMARTFGLPPWLCYGLLLVYAGELDGRSPAEIVRDVETAGLVWPTGHSAEQIVAGVMSRRMYDDHYRRLTRKSSDPNLPPPYASRARKVRHGVYNHGASVYAVLRRPARRPRFGDTDDAAARLRRELQVIDGGAA